MSASGSKQVWVPTAADWARYGARPMTPAEVKAEKQAIEAARKGARS